MKKIIDKVKLGVVQGISILLILVFGNYILQARNGADNLSGNTNDAVTSTKRNQLLTKLNTAIGRSGPDSLTASSGDKLTATKWNGLVTKINNLSTITCGNGTHLETNSCELSIKSCTVPNGNGTQTRTAGSWSTCQNITCNVNFYLVNGQCLAKYFYAANCSAVSGQCKSGTDCDSGRAAGSCDNNGCDGTSNMVRVITSSNGTATCYNRASCRPDQVFGCTMIYK